MKQTDWQFPTEKIFLTDNDIHIWLCKLNTNKEKLISLKKLLSPAELEKANKFHFIKDRNSFIYSHGNLRIILSKYINISPENIKFSHNKYGKPFLPKENNKNEISFNLSHSGEFCLIGITKKNKIGVDIEKNNNEFSTLEIAERYFSEYEYSEIVKLPITKRTKAFYNCWTRKEAYIKAEGKGLSIDLASFDVSISEDVTKILRINNNYNIENWQLYNLAIDNKYSAAVALSGQMKKIIKKYINNDIFQI